jgi:hypothetical protein
MQAFIVTHYARAKIVEARCECHQDDGGKYRYFVCDCRQSRMNRAFKPGTLVVFVGIFVGHGRVLYFKPFVLASANNFDAFNLMLTANITQKN